MYKLCKAITATHCLLCFRRVGPSELSEKRLSCFPLKEGSEGDATIRQVSHKDGQQLRLHPVLSMSQLDGYKQIPFQQPDFSGGCSVTYNIFCVLCIGTVIPTQSSAFQTAYMETVGILIPDIVALKSLFRSNSGT